MLGALVLSASTLAASDKPAAVQVCLTTPKEYPLFATHAGAGYRLLGEGVFMLDLDVALNGRVASKLTRSGADCLRAWVPATEPIRKVAVAFDRAALNLSADQREVDLKVKPDLWYDAGRFTITQLPYSQLRLTVPGQLIVERKSSDGLNPVTDLEQLPAGEYKIGFELPASKRRCEVTVRGVAMGSIRDDNKKAMVDELVEHYRTEYAPEVLADLKMFCNPGEAVEVELLIIDGVYFKPREPRLKKVHLPSKAPRYALDINGVRTAFQSGQMVTVHTGERIALEEVVEADLSATR
jgi:hypothetical protein